MAILASLRKANINDIAQIVKIENSSFVSDAFTKKQFRYLILSENSFFQVAVVDQMIVGYMILLKRKNSKTLRIYSIAIDLKFRNLNIGSILLEKAIDIAGSLQCSHLRLEVNENNAAAVQFYVKHLFTFCGSIDNYYNDGGKALKMEKKIVH
jgi:[ribosomal protein S18]-alanine N-acetyltransferase